MEKSFKPVISVKVVSDIACPWCYIGKKNLEEAVNGLQEKFDFDIEFSPFQLDPDIPIEGISREEYFNNKFGSPERAEYMFSRVETSGRLSGINFDFKGIKKAISTLPLHIILKKAYSEGIQTKVAERFFEAYMVHPLDLADKKVIAEIMKDFGWSEEKTLYLICDKEWAKAVNEEIATYRRMQISGVPFFIINDKYGISGAQPATVLAGAFSSLKPEDFEEGLNCDIDDKNC